jgi:pullulanase
MTYGEGWTADTAAIPYYEQALKANIGMMKGTGAFSDDIRDAIKGSVFDYYGTGFVNGGQGCEQRIKYGITAATDHPQVRMKGWTKSPSQSINYISCHDNLTFWDKLAIANSDSSREDRIRMNKLGAAIILTSQGVPFMQAGEEILRSKPSSTSKTGFEENSYKSPDEVNSIKWDEKTGNIDTYEYYKGLIAFRKANPDLRLTTADEIYKKLNFMDVDIRNVVRYRVGNIMAIFNANNYSINLNLPSGNWNIYVNDSKAGNQILGSVRDGIQIPRISAVILKAQ